MPALDPRVAEIGAGTESHPCVTLPQKHHSARKCSVGGLSFKACQPPTQPSKILCYVSEVRIPAQPCQQNIHGIQQVRYSDKVLLFSPTIEDDPDLFFLWESFCTSQVFNPRYHHMRERLCPKNHPGSTAHLGTPPCGTCSDISCTFISWPNKAPL